jgi:hypothetical protein
VLKPREVGVYAGVRVQQCELRPWRKRAGHEVLVNTRTSDKLLLKKFCKIFFQGTEMWPIHPQEFEAKTKDLVARSQVSMNKAPLFSREIR